MNLRHYTKNLLEENSIEPNKVLGQNFLVEESFIDYFIENCEFLENDTVIEVGAGLGNITKKIAEQVGVVYAVEKDPRLFDVLKKELVGKKNIEVIKEDILKIDTQNIVGDNKYRIAGAPPYYLTGRLFRTLLQDTKNKPLRIDFIIQKEVAEKITAKPPRNNLLSVSVQLYGTPKIQKTVPKNFFWPQPKVDSAVLAVENIKKPGINEGLFFSLLKAGFSSPRKQLGANLANKHGLQKKDIGVLLRSIDIEPTRRAETLSLEEWVRVLNHTG